MKLLLLMMFVFAIGFLIACGGGVPGLEGGEQDINVSQNVEQEVNINQPSADNFAEGSKCEVDRICPADYFVFREVDNKVPTGPSGTFDEWEDRPAICATHAEPAECRT